jgi:hypothetical protein
MSDRKYRQRGYQDEEPRKPASKPPSAEPVPREMRKPSFPGFREIVKCARCGSPVGAGIQPDSRCARCGTDLHSCAQCLSFDPAKRFECAQPIPERISPKDAANRCTVFEARVVVERETGSTAPPSARSAFDDLFK